MSPLGRMNLNDNVWVRLTDRGREIDREMHEQLLKVAPSIGPYVDHAKNGWSKFQLYRLMYILGPDCYIGADLPFDTEFSLVDPNLPGGSIVMAMPMGIENASDGTVVTPNEMRAAIHKASLHSPLVRNIIGAADRAGATAEDRYTMLAYHALVQLETYYKQVLELRRIHG